MIVCRDRSRYDDTLPLPPWGLSRLVAAKPAPAPRARRRRRKRAPHTQHPLSPEGAKHA